MHWIVTGVFQPYLPVACAGELCVATIGSHARWLSSFFFSWEGCTKLSEVRVVRSPLSHEKKRLTKQNVRAQYDSIPMGQGYPEWNWRRECMSWPTFLCSSKLREPMNGEYLGTNVPPLPWYDSLSFWYQLCAIVPSTVASRIVNMCVIVRWSIKSMFRSIRHVRRILRAATRTSWLLN